LLLLLLVNPVYLRLRIFLAAARIDSELGSLVFVVGSISAQGVNTCASPFIPQAAMFLGMKA
jgi:hypothetical protein